MQNDSCLLLDMDSELVTKADLAAAVDKTVDKTEEFMRDVQTEILRAIHGYVEASEARLKRLERNDAVRAQETADFNTRLVALESRVFEVERKLLGRPPQQ